MTTKTIYVCEQCEKRSDKSRNPGWIEVKGSITIGGGGGTYEGNYRWEWSIFALQGENDHHFCSPKCFELKTGFHYLKDFTDIRNRGF